MFWNVFYDLCIKRGVKPNPVAQSIGLSSAAMTKYKNGAMPSGDILSKIADYFGVTVDYLLGRGEPTAAEWSALLNRMSDENLDRLQEYAEFLLWRQAQDDLKAK